jgi:hypothetical protein
VVAGEARSGHHDPEMWKLGASLVGALVFVVVVSMAVAIAATDLGSSSNQLEGATRESAYGFEGPELPDELAPPERVKVQLADDGRFGWMSSRATSGANFVEFQEERAGDDLQAIADAWNRREIPITVAKDPSSKIIGYYSSAVGYALSLETMNAPGFDREALIQKTDALRQQLIDEVEGR